MIPRDYILEIAKHQVPNHLGVNKFGVNPAISTVDGQETIWDGGIPYAFPTVAQVHNLVSTSTEDAGVLVTSGTITSNSNTHVQDSSATFISDSVEVGDLFINDTKREHGIIMEVLSETLLKLRVLRCIRLGQTPVCRGISVGDSYRIASDTETGAAVVFAQGLNENFSEVSGYIIMNGTTPIASTVTFKRLFRMEVLQAGSASKNLGDISATADIDGTATAIIRVGNNQTLMAIFTIPRGVSGLLTSWWAGLANKQSAISTALIAWGEAETPLRVREPIVLHSQGQSHNQRIFEVPEMVTEMNDIIVTANVDANGVAVAAGFDLILVTNKELLKGIAVQ